MMEKIANFMPFRAKCLNTLKKHLDMEKEPAENLPTATSRDRAADGNICAMLDMMDESEMLPSPQTDPKLLRNPFTDTVATAEQMHAVGFVTFPENWPS